MSFLDGLLWGTLGRILAQAAGDGAAVTVDPSRANPEAALRGDVEAALRGDVEEALRWLELPPAWVVALVIVPCVAAFVAYFYRRERATGSSAWKWVLGGLRFTSIGLALLMLAQPVWHKRTSEKRDSTLLVLVDDSLSQDMADRFSDRRIPERLAELYRTTSDRIEDSTRYDLVRRLLRDTELGVVDKLREKGKVSIASFAKSVYPLVKLERRSDDDGGDDSRGPSAADAAGTSPAADPSAAGTGETGGGDASATGEGAPPLADGEYLPLYSRVREDSRVQETRVAEALRDAVAGVLGLGFGKRQERVSGVLLFSDFQQNADTISAVDVARRLRERPCPVFTIGVGNPDEPKDIRLLNVDVRDVVLVDDVVPFDATLVADGFEGERVRVDLSFGGEVVQTEYVTLLGGGQRQSVRLEYQPRRPGKFTATVEIEHQGGEVFPNNNSISKNVTVLDQKIKVLYAERLPRWEYRYLKNALVRDKTMEAQIFLFSADAGFPQDSTPGIPSLDRFPSERDELFEYHVVILGDVDPQEHLGAKVTALLREFVAEGGGLVFIAGPHSNPSRFTSAPDLYSLLPVEVAEAGVFNAQSEPIVKSFNARLTAVGREHPVMRLDNDAAQNVRLWENDDGQFYDHLPGFYWFARTGKAKAGAVVLATHPSEQQPLDPQNRLLPVFAFMNYGKGKTFFSAVDATWRWRAGVDNLYFYRFWGQVARFVASGRLLGKTPRHQISTDKEAYSIGELVRVECQVYDANMRPSDDPTVTIYHRAEDHDDEAPEGVELSLQIQGDGVYSGSLIATTRGRHDVWVGTENERLAFATYNVEVPALESRDTRLDRTLATRIAEVSGGAYYDLADVMQAVELIQGITRMDDGVIENDDVWDEWWVAVLVTTILAAEWILRKTVRLV